MATVRYERSELYTVQADNQEGLRRHDGSTMRRSPARYTAQNKKSLSRSRREATMGAQKNEPSRTARPRPSVASDTVVMRTQRQTTTAPQRASLTLCFPSESSTRHAISYDERYPTEESDGEG